MPRADAIADQPALTETVRFRAIIQGSTDC
jgi:hypothetical protein